MKLSVFLFSLGALVACVHSAEYTTKYDNIDVEEILKNERLYQRYFMCLSQNKKCTPDGKELRENMDDALKSECSKCSEKQKQGAEKVMTFMLKEKPEDFKILEEIFDPEKIYRTKYEAEAKKRGLELPE